MKKVVAKAWRGVLKREKTGREEEDNKGAADCKKVTWASPLACSSRNPRIGLLQHQPQWIPIKTRHQFTRSQYHADSDSLQDQGWTRVEGKRKTKTPWYFSNGQRSGAINSSWPTKRECSKNYPERKLSKLKRPCYRCGDLDHLIMECRNGRVCSRCHGIGHRAKNCRAILPGDGGRGEDSQRGRSMSSQRSSHHFGADQRRSTTSNWEQRSAAKRPRSATPAINVGRPGATRRVSPSPTGRVDKKQLHTAEATSRYQENNRERGRPAQRKEAVRHSSPPLKGLKFRDLPILAPAAMTVVLSTELLEKHYKVARRHVIMTVIRGEASEEDLVAGLMMLWPKWKWAWRPSKLSQKKFLVQFPAAADLEEIAQAKEYVLGDFTFKVQRWEASWGAHRRVLDKIVWIQITFTPIHFNHEEVLREVLRPLGRLLAVSKSAGETMGKTVAMVQLAVNEQTVIPPFLDNIVEANVYRIYLRNMTKTPLVKGDVVKDIMRGREEEHDDGEEGERRRLRENNRKGTESSAVLINREAKGKGIMTEEEMVQPSAKECRFNDCKSDDEEVDYSGEEGGDEGWKIMNPDDQLNTDELQKWPESEKEEGEIQGTMDSRITQPLDEDDYVPDECHVYDQEYTKRVEQSPGMIVVGEEYEDDRCQNLTADYELSQSKVLLTSVPETQFQILNYSEGGND